MFDYSSVWIRWSIRGIFLLVAGSSAAYSQQAGSKEFANRFEGTRSVPTALSQFTPIALTRNAIHFQHNSTLYVRFFLPPIPTAHGVTLRAKERQDSSNYFMDAKNPPWKPGDWNVFGPWPTKDVIDALEIDADNLAVLASYERDGASSVYLPVDIYEDESQLTGHTYMFHFVTGKPLQSLEISVTDATGAKVESQTRTLKCPTSINVNCKLYLGGSAQSFPLDLSRQPQGLYHLRLIGRIPGSLEIVSEDFVIYHHP
jgi:hypothetical protein